MNSTFESGWKTLAGVLFGVLAVLAGTALAVLISQDFSLIVSVGLVAGVIIAGISLLNPEVGLLLLVFITYTRSSDVAIYYHGAPSLARWMVALVGMALLLRWILMGETPRGWGKPALLLVAYGLVGFSSLFYASNPVLSEDAFSDYIKDAALALILVLMVQKPGILQKVLWALILAGAFMATITAYQQLTQTFTNEYGGFGQAPLINIVGETQGRRLSGPIGDPNYYGQILVALVPLAFNRMLREKNWALRILAAWSLGVMLYSIMFTYSRGAFVALIFVAGLAFLYRRPRPIEIAGAILAVVLIIPLLPPTYRERMATVLDLTGGESQIRQEVSFRGRASELMVAMMMFRDSPLLGVGVKNYPELYQSYSRRLGIDPRTEQREPHNLFLEVAAETGLVGTLVFFSILWTAYAGLFQARTIFARLRRKQEMKLAESIGFALTAYLAAAMFIHGAYPRYLWLLIGLALAVPQVAYQMLERVSAKTLMGSASSALLSSSEESDSLWTTGTADAHHSDD